MQYTDVSLKGDAFAPDMHFMSQPRCNPRTQRDDWYYRIKESFRDLTGRVRCRVVLNVGFINEPHRPEDIRDIGKCLTNLQYKERTSPMSRKGPLWGRALNACTCSLIELAELGIRVFYSCKNRSTLQPILHFL